MLRLLTEALKSTKGRIPRSNCLIIKKHVESPRVKLKGKKINSKACRSLHNNWSQFHQHFTCSFCTRRSKKYKKGLTTWQSFLCFWDLRAKKLLVECWCNSPLIMPTSARSKLSSILHWILLFQVLKRTHPYDKAFPTT